jgi:hypothetical protein
VTNLPPAPYIQSPRILLNGGTLKASVNTDGTFEFPHVFPGSYTVSTFGLSSTFTGRVEVSDSDISGLDIALNGQIAYPFPGFPGGSPSAVFNLGPTITLQGVVTQEIELLSPGLLGYFRMEIIDPSGAPKSWAVLLGLPSQSRRDIPDLAKLKKGSRIIVKGYRAEDGSNRVLLEPSTGSSTLLGIELAP